MNYYLIKDRSRDCKMLLSSEHEFSTIRQFKPRLVAGDVNPVAIKRNASFSSSHYIDSEGRLCGQFYVNELFSSTRLIVKETSLYNELAKLFSSFEEKNSKVKHVSPSDYKVLEAPKPQIAPLIKETLVAPDIECEIRHMSISVIGEAFIIQYEWPVKSSKKDAPLRELFPLLECGKAHIVARSVANNDNWVNADNIPVLLSKLKADNLRTQIVAAEDLIRLFLDNMEGWWAEDLDNSNRVELNKPTEDIMTQTEKKLIGYVGASRITFKQLSLAKLHSDPKCGGFKGAEAAPVYEGDEGVTKIKKVCRICSNEKGGKKATPPKPASSVAISEQTHIHISDVDTQPTCQCCYDRDWPKDHIDLVIDLARDGRSNDYIKGVIHALLGRFGAGKHIETK